MASEIDQLERVPLDDLTEEGTPITYGVVKPGEEGDVAFVRGGDIAGGRVLMSQLRTISREVSQQYRRTVLRGGEILVSLVGNPGQVAIAPSSLAGANIARQVGLVRLKPRVDTRYVSYFLQSREGQIALGAQSLGSVQQVINLRDLKTIKVPLPSLASQKAIASILGALDNKIELNRRMNATLEATARAVYQSWFVDFDPVRAKLDGRKPTGLDEATVALFSSAFQDSSLGLIPQGWHVKPLGEVIELAYGKPLKAEDRKDGPVRVCGANGPVGWHDERLVSGPGLVVGRKGNPGVVTWVHEDFYPIDTTFYVVPLGKYKSLYFLYHALSAQDLASLSADSAVPGLNRNHVYMSKQVIPPDPVLSAFNSLASVMFAKIYENEVQARTLAAFRHALLPKLISGELSAKQVRSAQ